MTKDTGYVTTRELMNKIEELEAKLAPPEPESLSSKMIRQARAVRDRNTVTMPIESIMGTTDKKPERSINDQLRKAAGEGR